MRFVESLYPFFYTKQCLLQLYEVYSEEFILRTMQCKFLKCGCLNRFFCSLPVGQKLYKKLQNLYFSRRNLWKQKVTKLGMEGEAGKRKIKFENEQIQSGVSVQVKKQQQEQQKCCFLSYSSSPPSLYI